MYELRSPYMSLKILESQSNYLSSKIMCINLCILALYKSNVDVIVQKFSVNNNLKVQSIF